MNGVAQITGRIADFHRSLTFSMPSHTAKHAGGVKIAISKNRDQPSILQRA
jgi:hypothetical protein